MLFFSYHTLVCLCFILLAGAFFAVRKKTLKVEGRLLRIFCRGLHFYLFTAVFLFGLSLPFVWPVKLLFVGVVTWAFLRQQRTQALLNLPSSFGAIEFSAGFVVLGIGVLVASYLALLYGDSFLGDWPKHRSVLLSLAEHPFRPTLTYFGLPSERAESLLVYYYGQYLPSAYMGSLLNQVSPTSPVEIRAYLLTTLFFLWNLAGICLSLLFLPTAVSRLFGSGRDRKPFGPFFFGVVFFSGADYWLYAARHFDQLVALGRPAFAGHLEGNPFYMAQYSSFLTAWIWVPQHLVPSLLTLTIFGLYARQFASFPWTLVMTYLMASSLFGLLGFIPIILFLAIRHFVNSPVVQTFREIWPEAMMTMVSCLVLLLFYTLKSHPETLQLNPSYSTPNGVFFYLLFLLVELLPFFLAASLQLVSEKKLPGLIWVSLLSLSILPLFRLGLFNDLVMRASIPCLLVLMGYSGLFLETCLEKRNKACWTIAFLFLLSFFPSFANEFRMSIGLQRGPFLETQPWIVKQYEGFPTRGWQKILLPETSHSQSTIPLQKDTPDK